MTLKLGSAKTYFIFGEDNVRQLFAQSKCLAKEGLAMSSFQDPRADVQTPTDKTAPNQDGPSEHAHLGRRLQDLQVRMLAPGAEMERLAATFSTRFQETLRHVAGARPVPVRLFRSLRAAMLEASTRTLMGADARHLAPGFSDTYWAFDAALLRRRPDAPAPHGGSIRTAFLAAIARYADAAQRRLRTGSAPVAGDAEAGSRLFRAYVRALDAALPDAPPAQRAHHLVPLVWATASNAVPAAVWMLAELLQRPALLPRARAEAASAALPGQPVTFDLPKLAQRPLLGSLYLEVLRTRASVTVRRPLAADAAVGGYALRRGNDVLAPSWPAHRDPEVWDGDGHPPEEFWAERFLPALEGPAADDGAPDAAGGARARLARAMRPENFFPYGGGGAVCPGRHFAKYEILTAVAVLLLGFDFEVVGYVDADGERWAAGPPVPRQECGGGGVMPPDCDMLVRMSKRQLGKGSRYMDVL